jgi:hypothetical protein
VVLNHETETDRGDTIRRTDVSKPKWFCDGNIVAVCDLIVIDSVSSIGLLSHSVLLCWW